jgi:hypothetical protein
MIIFKAHQGEDFIRMKSAMNSRMSNLPQQQASLEVSLVFARAVLGNKSYYLGRTTGIA